MKDSNDATVGERLVERISLTHTLLDDNERLRAEIARLRLTDAEREAVEFFAAIHAEDDPPHEYAVILGKLLARLA